jgi:DNA-directed RNA polymerase subunit K/omega
MEKMEKRNSRYHLLVYTTSLSRSENMEKMEKTKSKYHLLVYTTT